MSKANEEWKVLKPQIGAFINTLDGLYKGAEDMDEAVSNAYKKGYEKGVKEDKKVFCDYCKEKKFYELCNGNYRTIELFVNLPWDKRKIASDIILALSEKEKRDENSI